MSIDLAAKAKESRAILVLIPLLLLHLALLSFQIEDPAGTLLLNRWVVLMTAPFLYFSDAVSERVVSVWMGYVWLHGAREENRQLHEAMRQMSLRDSSTAQLREENARLRRLLGLAESLSFDNIGARVVGRTPNYLSHTIYIDKGATDGLRLDCPVVSENGILGRTILVSPHHSQVQLISNTDSSVGVMIASNRLPGVLRGQGDQKLTVHYIGNTEQVNQGELVITSGLDGIFPKGLPVGRVIESRRGKSVFRDIDVEPFADLVRTEEVLVLLPKPKPE